MTQPLIAPEEIVMKTVILTGATGAIGAAVYHTLSKNYFVIAQGRNAKIGKQLFLNYANSSEFIKADFLNENSIVNFINDVTRVTGQVYAVVHCIGGGGEHRNYLETDESKWLEVYYSNVVVPNLINQHCLLRYPPNTIRRFVAIGSVAATKPLAIGVEYSAAKAALIASYKSLAFHFRGTGATANIISPGLVKTDQILEYVSEKYAEGTDVDLDELATQHMFDSLTKRLSTPEQIAAQVEFLLGEHAANITGENIVIDGGYSVI